MYLNKTVGFGKARSFQTKLEAEAVLLPLIKHHFSPTHSGVVVPTHFVISRSPGNFVPVVVMLSAMKDLLKKEFQDAGVYVVNPYSISIPA